VGVTGGSQDLEYVIFDRQERNVESSTSEIVDNDLGFRLAGSVKTVGCLSVEFNDIGKLLTDGGGGGLVDDSKNGETGDGSSILGSGSLSIVEV
jgi:hypothetical protein